MLRGLWVRENSPVCAEKKRCRASLATALQKMLAPGVILHHCCRQ
jgi:hypothetical protein